MKTKPFQHQSQALQFIFDNPRSALFLDTGLGKSWIALALIEKLNKKTIIICPNSVKYVWIEEIKKHLKRKLSYHVINRKIKKPKKKILIVNYEFLRKPDNVDKLIELKPNILVFDESTEIKNPMALQTKGAYKLSKHPSVQRVILLNGTPITENQMDIFGQYLVMNDKLFGRNFYNFRKIFFVNIMKTKPYATFPIWKFNENFADFFYSIIRRSAFIKRKEECIDLAPKIYEKRIIVLTKEQQNLYKKIKDEFLIKIQGKEVMASTIISKLMKFQQIADGFIYSSELEPILILPIEKNPKVKEVLNLINNHPHYRILIWIKFKGDRVIFQKIKNLLNAKDIRIVESKEDLKDYKTFKERIIVVPLKLGRYGFTIPADMVLYYSNDFSYNTRIQSEARSFGRLGLKNKTTFIDIIAKDTIDESILKILEKKKQITNLTFNKKLLEKFITGKLD